MSKWPKVRLGDCCTVVSGATPKTDKREYWDGDIKWVTPKDISKLDQPYLLDTPDRITRSGYESCSTTMLPAGCVLVTSRAPIGNVAINAEPMCTNQGFKSLIPGENVDSLYLYFCMKQASQRLADLGNGATFKEVSKKVVEDFEISLPPLEEQKRIAAILDKADSLRRKRAQAIALADDFLRATFLDLFGDPVTNPKGWVVKPLIELVDPDRPITYGILMPGEDQEDGVKYVRVVDMKEGGIDTTSVKKTTQAISDNYRRSLLKKGDLVMSIRGHVGRLASIPSDLDGANITQDTARLAIVGVDPLYVKYFLRSPVMQYWMAQHTKGAAVKGINLTDVKRIPIQIPSSDLQAIFSDQVQKIENYLKKSAIFHCDALAGYAALQNEVM